MSKKVIYINYFDAITEGKVKALMSVLSEAITQESPDALYFLMSSAGGQVEAGVVLYNFLKALPIPIIMHNTGSIDSIANIVFLGADVRYACVHASFLFHGIIWTFAANASVNKNQLTEILSSLSLSELKLASIITERTKLTPAELEQLFRQGETKDAQFALEKGIVVEVKDPEIPPGARLLSFNLAN